MSYLPIRELRFGHNDASQYISSPDQDLFHRFFLSNPQMEKIISSPCYYIVGEKGTGKTSSAAYYSNWSPGNVIGKTIFVQKNDYDGFAAISRADRSGPVNYTEVWQALIILLLFSWRSRLSSAEKSGLSEKAAKLRSIIDRLSFNSFDDTIAAAFDLIGWNTNQLLQELIGDGQAATSPPVRTFLRLVKNTFAQGLQELDPGNRTFLLFVDGIDMRPFADEGEHKRLDYAEYMNCVRGLVNAIWIINNEILRPRFGHNMRAILLIRPDILDRVGLQNLNNIMKDNSFLIDWYTPYKQYRTSQLFRLSDNILLQQQPKPIGEEYNIGTAWDTYFPEKTINRRNEQDDSFISFLRNSFYRPRDIITLLEYTRERACELNRGSETVIPTSLTWENVVRKRFSEYLLGEVKDSLAFYHETEEYDLFLKFFEYLAEFVSAGHIFTYDDFEDAFSRFQSFIEKNKLDSPVIFSTADSLLQFLYELNIVSFRSKGYMKGVEVQNWCFHQRSYANIRPKIQTHNENYQLHYGIARALYPSRIG